MPTSSVGPGPGPRQLPSNESPGPTSTLVQLHPYPCNDHVQGQSSQSLAHKLAEARKQLREAFKPLVIFVTVPFGGPWEQITSSISENDSEPAKIGKYVLAGIASAVCGVICLGPALAIGLVVGLLSAAQSIVTIVDCMVTDAISRITTRLSPPTETI